MSTTATWFDMAHPGAYGARQALLAQAGGTEGIERVAVMVKTEGHTAANDYARQLSRSVLDPMLAPFVAQGAGAAVLANGCEGLATPGGYALIRRRSATGEPSGGLRLGLARS